MIEFIETNLAWFIIGLIIFDIFLLFEIGSASGGSRRVANLIANKVDDMDSELYELRRRLEDIEGENNHERRNY
jgi:hypothetical protein